MDVSIIILNYNTRDLTLSCIESVFKHTINVKWELILIDNGSIECDPQIFKNRFPEINLIINKKNVGFSSGVNLGIENSSGKYILLLNSDTKLLSNSIRHILDYIDDKPNIAVCSPRLIFPNGAHQSVAQRFPNPWLKVFEILRLQKILKKNISGSILLGSFFDHNTSLEVDWVWGTFFLFRRSVLDLMPGNKLNDKYFMYGEDMQWCYDFKRRGFKIFFLHTTSVIHYLRGSSSTSSKYSREGMDTFLKENYSVPARFILKTLDFFL